MLVTPCFGNCSNKYKLAREGEKDYVFFKFRMKSSSVKRDEFSIVVWRFTGIQHSGWGWEDHSTSQERWTRLFWRGILSNKPNLFFCWKSWVTYSCHGWQTITQVIRWPHHLNLINSMDINSTATIIFISHIQYIRIVPLQALIAHLLTLPDTLHQTQLCSHFALRKTIHLFSSHFEIWTEVQVYKNHRNYGIPHLQPPA